MKKALATSLLSVLLLAGCSGDEPSGPSNPSDTYVSTVKARLAGKTWLTQLYKRDNSPFGSSSSSVPERIRINADGTYTRLMGNSSISGNWALDSNGHWLRFLDQKYSWRIAEITDNMLHLRALDPLMPVDTASFWSAAMKEPQQQNMLTGRQWKMEKTLVGTSDQTSSTAGTTVFTSDGNYRTDYLSGSSKEGKWELVPPIGAEDLEIRMDVGKTVEQTWRIIELSDKIMEMTTGNFYVLQSTSGASHSGGKNDWLTAREWTITSMTREGQAYDVGDMTPAGIRFDKSGRMTTIARSGHLTIDDWKLVGDGAQLRLGAERYAEVLELSPTALKFRRIILNSDGTKAAVLITTAQAK